MCLRAESSADVSRKLKSLNATHDRETASIT
jgi:hypothetical protein